MYLLVRGGIHANAVLAEYLSVGHIFWGVLLNLIKKNVIIYFSDILAFFQRNIVCCHQRFVLVHQSIKALALVFLRQVAQNGAKFPARAVDALNVV